MAWWMWVVFGIGLLAVEVVTPGGLFALFFGFGALVVAILVMLGLAGSAAVQWLVFAAVSGVALVGLRRHLRRMIGGRHEKMDTLVGEVAVLLQDLPPQATGKAELRGAPWDARNGGSATLNRGQRCQVERVEGLTLWVRPE